jgi:hypothetical protein
MSTLHIFPKMTAEAKAAWRQADAAGFNVDPQTGRGNVVPMRQRVPGRLIRNLSRDPYAEFTRDVFDSLRGGRGNDDQPPPDAA